MLFAIVLAGFAAYELAQALRKAGLPRPAHPAAVAAAVIAVPIAYFSGCWRQLARRARRHRAGDASGGSWSR